MSDRPNDSLRERKKRAKLDRIMSAARVLFAERGFAGTTTRAISEQAGIGTGTLFSYFPDKTALLVHLFVTEIEAAASAGFETVPPDAELTDQLLHVFERLYDYYGEAPALSKVVIKEIIFLQSDHRSLGNANLQFVARLANLVRDAKMRSEVAADAAPLLVATGCFAQYFFVLTTWLNGAIASRDSARLLLRQLLEMVIPMGDSA